MELIPINIDNVDKAKQYLASIGKLQEYNNKQLADHHWYAVIQFANTQIQIQNGHDRD